LLYDVVSNTYAVYSNCTTCTTADYIQYNFGVRSAGVYGVYWNADASGGRCVLTVQEATTGVTLDSSVPLNDNNGSSAMVHGLYSGPLTWAGTGNLVVRWKFSSGTNCWLLVGGPVQVVQFTGNPLTQAFINLTDVSPQSYSGQANAAVVVNSAATGLTFRSILGIKMSTPSYPSGSATAFLWGATTYSDVNVPITVITAPGTGETIFAINATGIYSFNLNMQYAASTGNYYNLYITKNAGSTTFLGAVTAAQTVGVAQPYGVYQGSISLTTKMTNGDLVRVHGTNYNNGQSSGAGPTVATTTSNIEIIRIG